MSILTDEPWEEDIVVLTDEEGKDHEFEIVDIIEFEQREFALLLPYSKDGVHSEDEEVLVLGYNGEGTGPEFSMIGDEDEAMFRRLAKFLLETVGN